MRIFVCFLISFIFLSALHGQTITPAGPINLCQGSSQVLTVNPAATSYQWQLNASNIPGATLISYTVTSAGNYTVILNGGANPGDTLGPVVVSIIPKPIPSFTFTPNNTCANIPVTFTNTSTGVGVSYLWNFGDPNSGANNTSTATNPVHNFIGNPGTGTQTFIVKLVATGSNGCKDSVTATVTNSQRPGTELGGTGSTTYNGLPYFKLCTTSSSAVFTFINQSTTVATNTNYKIVWGDASADFNQPTFTNTTHTYNVGNYNLLFIVSGSNGCFDTARYYVFVGSNPAVGLGNPGGTDICMQLALTFPINLPPNNPNPPGTTYTVTFNDGTPPVVFTHPPPASVTHVFATSSCGTTSSDGTNTYPNSFSAVIVASNPCGTSSGGVVPIYVAQKPVPSFVLSRDTACVNTVISVTNNGINGTPGNGTCNATSGKQVWSVSPATGWTLAGGTRGNDNGFNDPALWTNGSTTIQLNFTVAGVYTIKLKVGATAPGTLCGIDSIIKTICVNPLAVAAFTANPVTGCAPLTVNTNNTSPAPFCGQNTYNWSVTYAATAGCLPNTNGASFINGTNAASANPQFLFNNPGIYTIRLITIAPAAACSSAVVTQQIIVKGKPVVNLPAVPSICVNQSVTPTQTSTCYINAATTYDWQFPGGTPSSSTLPSPGPITYSGQGTFTITLAVTNECGTTTVTTPVTVNQTPTAIVPANIEVCAGSSVGPLGFSSNPAGAAITWTNSNTAIGLAASGNGNITTFTATNPGATPITSTITVRAAFGVCFSTSTFTITVNPAPTVNAVTNKTYCAGATTAIIPFTGNIAAATYNWINSNPSIGLAASGAGDIPSFTATNAGTTPITATITVTPVYTGGATNCPGTPRSFTITINPIPAVNAVSDQTLCAGTQTTLISFSGAVAGTIYNWTNSNPAIGLATSGAGNIAAFTATNAGTTPITATVTVTPAYTNSALTCSGTPTTFTITVNPSPTVNAIANQTLCAGSSTTAINFTGNQATAVYNWTNSNPSIGLAASGAGDIASFTATNAGAIPITATITVTPVYTNNAITCSGTPRNFTIVVNPIPAVNNINNQTLCAGALTTAVNFTGPVAGTVYGWTNSNPTIGLATGGTGSIAAFTAINAGTTPVTATITVTPSYTNNAVTCTGSPTSFTITVNPSPTINAVPNQTVCAGASTTAIAFTGNQATATYNWTNSNPAIGLAGGGAGDIPSFTAINTGVTPITATITVTPVFTNNSVTCSGTPRSFAITVNPTPTVNNVNNQTVCAGALTTAINFSGAVASTAYSWVNSNPAIGLGAGSNGNIPAFTATNAGTTPITGTITVTPNYTNNAVTCSGTPTSFTITVNPSPTVNTISNQAVCAGSSTTIINFSGAVTGTVFNWTNNNAAIGLAANGTGDIASFVAANSGSTPITATITVTPVFTNNTVACSGSPKTFTITVNPKPAITNKVAVICSGSSFTVIPVNAGAEIVPAGTTYTWGIPTVTGGLTGGSAGTNQTSISGTLINPGNLAQTATYTITPTSGAGGNCVGAAFTITVTVNPRPFAGDEVASICSENSFTVTPSNATPGNIIPAGTLYTWTNPVSTPLGAVTGGSAQSTGQTNISQTLTNTINVPATLTYTVTPSSGANCTGLPFTIVVTVKPKPQLTSPINPPAVCTNTPFNYTSVSSTANTTFTWTRAAVPGISNPANTGSGAAINETLINTTTSPVTVVYVIDMTDNGCPNSQAVSLVVNPNAKSEFITDTTIGCAPFNINQHLTVIRYQNANDEAQYKWFAGAVQIGTGLAVPNYQITTPGAIVTITLIAKSKFGCKDDTSSLILRTVERPVPSFTKSIAAACGPVSVLFTNTTTPITVLNGTNYLWNFGNGITSTQVQPGSVTFQPSPFFRDTVYIVTLTVTTACDIIVKTDSVKVYANPKARFTSISTGCSPFRDTLINNSFGQDAFTEYYWDFGDGTRDTTYSTGSLFHTYNTGVITTFIIRLIMQNRCGRDTQFVNVVVSPLNIQQNITVNGTDLFGCAPHTAFFQNSSTGAALLHVNYDDGSPIVTIPNSQSVFNHTFLNPGTYNVQINLQNSCTDTTVIRQITVYPPPKAIFTLQRILVCTGDTIFTNNTSANANAYEWLWGDGNSNAAFNSFHVYPNAGTYFVRLVAKRVNNFGIVCTDTAAPITVTVVPRVPAIVLLNSNTLPCLPYTVNVTASNAATASQIDWYFYDATVAPGVFHFTGPQAAYTYNTAGVYNVKLVVQTIAGCKDSITRQFTVSKKPDVLFTPLDVITCNADTTITFNLNVNANGANPVTYDWFINNQFAGNGNPFTRRFTVPAGVPATNIFAVKVFVRNAFGCGDTVVIGNLTIKTIAARYITVKPSLVQTQPDYTFTFSDTATALPNSIYTWTTGDRSNQQLSGKSITYTYGDTGTYKVKMLLKDYASGCVLTDSVKVYILHVPGYLYVANAFCPGCAKAELRQFLPLGKGLKDYHLVIYNIYGQKIFETSSLDANGSPNQGWNGSWPGGGNINVKQGAYSWQIQAHYVNGGEWKGMLDPKNGKLYKQGFITILR